MKKEEVKVIIVIHHKEVDYNHQDGLVNQEQMKILVIIQVQVGLIILEQVDIPI